MRRPLLTGACALACPRTPEPTAPSVQRHLAPIAASRSPPRSPTAPTWCCCETSRPRSTSTTHRATSCSAGQDDILTSIGEPETLYRYTSAVDGFAAELTTAAGQATPSRP